MRATEIFEIINADDMPTVREAYFEYPRIDAVSGFNRAKLGRLRKKYRKQNEMVQLPDRGNEDV